MPAFATESVLGEIRSAAVGASFLQFCPTLTTQFCALKILGLALWAVHFLYTPLQVLRCSITTTDLAYHPWSYRGTRNLLTPSFYACGFSRSTSRPATKPMYLIVCNILDCLNADRPWPCQTVLHSGLASYLVGVLHHSYKIMEIDRLGFCFLSTQRVGDFMISQKSTKRGVNG